MGVFNPSHERTFLSTNDLSSGKQYLGVAIDTSNANSIVLANAQTLPTIGILLNDPKAGDAAHVALFGPTIFAVAGGTITRGDSLTTDSGGKLITTTTPADKVIGIAIESAVVNDRFEVMLSGGHFYHA